MDKLFGRHRKEESDEKPSDDIKGSAGDDDGYGGDAYNKKGSYTTGDDVDDTRKTSDNSNAYGGSVGYGGEDYTKKSSDNIGGDNDSEEVGDRAGEYSEKASYDTGDGGFRGSDEFEGSEKSNYTSGGAGYSDKASYDTGDGGFGNSDEYGGSEKPKYSSVGGQKPSYDTVDGGFAGSDEYGGSKNPTYASGRGDGGGDYSFETTSDTVGGVGKGGYTGEDYPSEKKASRRAEDSVGDFE